MNTINDFDRRAVAWLADGPSELSDRVLEAALREVHVTRQRHRWSAPWRTLLMPMRTGLAAAALATAIAVGGLFILRPQPSGTGSAGPSATTSPVPSVAPSVAPSAEASPSEGPVSFTSPLYGYTVSVPPGWVVTDAALPWREGERLTAEKGDLFKGPPASPDYDDVLVASQPVPDGMTPDEWLTRHAQQQAASGRDCKAAVDDWKQAVVGSLSIRRVDLECQGIRLSDVAFVVGGRGYAMSGNRAVIARFLDTFEQGG